MKSRWHGRNQLAQNLLDYAGPLTRGQHELYREIVEHARLAVGVHWVQLTQYLPDAGDVRQLAISSFHLPRMQRAARAFSRLMGGMPILDVMANVSENAFVHRLYAEGMEMEGRERDVTGQQVPRVVVNLAEAVGMRWMRGFPLKIGGQVRGALNFHSAKPLTARQRIVARAMSRQVELLFENAELSQHLAQSVQDLKEVQTRLMLEEDRIKSELAMELHGRVQTRLLILWRRLNRVIASMEPGDPQRIPLESIAENLDQIRDVDVRGVSHRLAPPILAAGLHPSLLFLGSLYYPEMDVAVTTDPILGPREYPALPPEVRFPLYRIVEEALANAYHHGHANHAVVHWAFGADHLTLTIRDDGIGVNGEVVEEGLGLVGMRTRAQYLGGTFAIHPVREGGCEVIVSVPGLDAWKEMESVE